MCMSQMSKSRLTLLVSDGIAWYCLVLLGIMWFKLVPDAHTLCHFLFAASVPSSLAPRTASCFLHSHWRLDISVKKRGFGLHSRKKEQAFNDIAECWAALGAVIRLAVSM